MAICQNMCKIINIIHTLGLDRKSVDFVSIAIVIDFVILESSPENIYKSITLIYILYYGKERNRKELGWCFFQVIFATWFYLLFARSQLLHYISGFFPLKPVG